MRIVKLAGRIAAPVEPRRAALPLLQEGITLYTVRPCQPQDLAAVARLSALWAAEDITYGLVPNSEEQLQQQWNNGPFLVAVCGAELIGYANGNMHVSDGLAVIPAGERYLEVDEVYVHPDHRSSGIGRRMLEALLQDAEGQGVSRALVYSATKDWSRMVDFYGRLGFKMWSVQLFR